MATHSRATRNARLWTRAGVVVCCIAVFAPFGGGADAQLISIKTVPVAQGDQYGFLPTANLGMAGVSIALNDTLLDPFSNPATGARLRGTSFVGSPSVYSVSRNSGGGRTLPLGGIVRSGSTYGGMILAIQEISPPQRTTPPFIGVADLSIASFPTGPEQPQEPRNNRYVFATLGQVFSKQNLSIAGSAFWSGLNAVDGVDMLYAGSRGVRQSGQALDVRLGMLKQWGGQNDNSLEVVAVRNAFDMTHDVTYLDLIWDPATRRTISQSRIEHNPDRTNTLGLHAEYERPLADSGWRIGGLVTGNRMSHPKIPNYEIMNIPRDPGTSWAYNLGVGVSKTSDESAVGIDVIYEPIWSHTWAEAEGAIDTPDGVIPAGGKTIENRFRFSNALLRAGVSRTLLLPTPESSLRLQFGIQMRPIQYRLQQHDHVQDFGRSQAESWTEWTTAWGASFRFPEFELHYRSRSISGTGRPGLASSFNRPDVADGRNVLLAPSGPLTLDRVRVTTHQFSVSVPLR